MNKIRKEIIINEIEYWKKSRLLPEHYCDFLLTLYSEGEYVSANSKTKKKNNKTNLASYFSIFLMLILPIGFLFIYFTEFTFNLQITVQIFLLLVSICASLFYFKKNRLYFTYYLVFTLLTSFLLSILTIEFFFGVSLLIMGTVVVTHFVIWYVLGHLIKLKYLKVIGTLGVIVFIIYLVFGNYF